MKKVVYKIECEWDLGLYSLYSSREDALADLNNIDWPSMLDEEASTEQLMEEGLLSIKEITVK